jgi:hypothetical protein
MTSRRALVVLVAFLALAGCGGSKDSGDDTRARPTTTPVTAAVDEGDQVIDEGDQVIDEGDGGEKTCEEYIDETVRAASDMSNMPDMPKDLQEKAIAAAVQAGEELKATKC